MRYRDTTGVGDLTGARRSRAQLTNFRWEDRSASRSMNFEYVLLWNMKKNVIVCESKF